MKRDEKIKKKAKEKAAKESEEELYDEVFDEEYYGHLHDDAYMSADASEKVQQQFVPQSKQFFSCGQLSLISIFYFPHFEK